MLDSNSPVKHLSNCFSHDTAMALIGALLYTH